MSHVPYSYKKVHSRRYVFMSVGKIEIKKVVDFVPLKTKNFMNMGFGDLLPDGSIDDTVSSNNGDIIKVLTTFIQ
jgi:hypothetical protein